MYYVIDAVVVPWAEILERYAKAEELRALISRNRESARQEGKVGVYFIVLTLQVEGRQLAMTIPYGFNQRTIDELRYKSGTYWKEDLKKIVNGDS